MAESETEAYHNASIDGRKSSPLRNGNDDDGKMSRKSNHPMYIVYKAGKPQRKFNSSSSSSSASNQSNYVSVFVGVWFKASFCNIQYPFKTANSIL
jgi:hypothetical protein